ncbi:zinc finger protein 609-like [Megalops cyprinoides]|uniref:zinc finger protein 609-like n=1 Tax=Megalops cyprinoides TaxID=118141 RepID=UPI001864F378|nr:zinc finger protein 609-like [Megalops cyprinoides]
MSLSGGTTVGKGVDSNAVDTYDSGDEWDIGVGNLIIDLDADLEKDKLEMSGTKDGGGVAAPPSAVAALPDNIKLVSPVPAPQGKESKTKSKRSKNCKDGGKASGADGPKREAQGRTQGEGVAMAASVGGASSGKAVEKSGKASRSVPTSKKDKEAGSGKSKKEKTEGVAVTVVATEKEAGSQAAALGAARSAPFEGTQSTDLAAAEQLGNIALDSAGTTPPSGIKTEPEEMDNGECRALKKVKSEKMESPVPTATPAPPPGGSGDISSACEQIIVRTRSVAANTSDVALATEPDCLGPCEPGTSVNLEGIVWQETEDGMLVVNVTWRNKTYVGTLLDCTRHDWAPPRFCESPTSDLEMRNGRGRGKRVRPNSNTPVNENSNSSDNKGSSSSKTRAGSNSKGRRGSQNSSERRTPPNSNTEDVKASPSSASKRKSKPASDMEPNSSSEDTKGSKRMRTNSSSGAPPAGLPVPSVLTEPLPPPLDRNCPSPVLIDCPHPNCNKKYKHINGLRYHQARAHNDDDIKLDLDGDSEYGEDSTLHPEPGSCNGASSSQKGCLSPARSLTPKGRGFDAQSPSPSGKFSSKPSGKKRPCDGEAEAGAVPLDGCEDGPCLTDEASNDGVDDRKADKDKSKKSGGGAKSDKTAQKSVKSARPIAPAIPPQQLYTLQAAAFAAASPGSASAMTTVVQAVPKSPQLKSIQPKPTGMGDAALTPAMSGSKDKKKKDKKRKETKEGDSPKPQGKGGREEGKSPYSEPTDTGGKSEALLNGSSDPHQSRLASIKAEADKIYSFTDNAPSPSIGVASRIDSGGAGQPLTPLHMVTQNGADNSSVKTNSPAYSDISDAGEDGEGKVEGVKAKGEDQASREGAKKALFPSQTPNKESPYYASYDSYYSPSYAHPSPGGSGASAPLGEGQAVKVKKEIEEQGEEKVKVEPQEERKAECSAPSQQQASVIQQRSNMYMQPLYYNQYAYVPPYGYPEQAYHAQLMSTSAVYRQQYEERQRQVAEQHRAAEKKSDAALKEREASMKEEWKHKGSAPPTLSKAPSVSDLGKPPPPGKVKDSSEPTKSVIIPKGEESKAASQQAEGLKGKLGEGGHHGKEEQKPGLDPTRPGMEPAMWYRQEPDSRLWPYVYPSKYPETPKQQQEEEVQRWKEEREREKERERERKGKEERPRPKDSAPKEEGKESSDPRTSAASSDDHRVAAKEPRPTAHMQFPGLAQHQPYMPYMHGYPYAQGYDPNHPGYRGMPSVMMQNYPGSYLSAGYSFPPYGAKMGSEEGEKSRASPTVAGKSTSEAKALDILQQHASQYKSKSPTVSEKPPHERERGGADRDRDADRPRSSPSQRIMPSHHHALGYPLLSGQYDLSYATGLSSSAIVASQQAAAPSLYPPARR